MAETDQPVDDPRKAIDQRFRAEVNDANLLLEWAVASGHEFDRTLVLRIKKGYEVLDKEGEGMIEARTDFESCTRVDHESSAPSASDCPESPSSHQRRWDGPRGAVQL